MPDRTNLKINIKLRNQLSANDKLWMIMNTDEKGDRRQRRWQGLKPYPRSIVDKNGSIVQDIVEY